MKSIKDLETEINKEYEKQKISTVCYGVCMESISIVSKIDPIFLVNNSKTNESKVPMYLLPYFFIPLVISSIVLDSSTILGFFFKNPLNFMSFFYYHKRRHQKFTSCLHRKNTFPKRKH